MNYSQSHLDEFLKSHGAQTGALLGNALRNNQGGNPGAGGSTLSSQHLIQSFMSSYKAAGASLRGRPSARNVIKNDDGIVENIPERNDEDEIELDEQIEEGTENEPSYGPTDEIADDVEVPSKQQFTNLIDKTDINTKEGYKELMRFQMRIFDQQYDFN